VGVLESLPRAWISLDLPGYRDDPGGGTYGTFPSEGLPPIQRTLDSHLHWLLGEPAAPDWAILNPKEVASFEVGKSRIFQRQRLPLPDSFAAFIASPAPASRIRSGTGCYVDFADHAVPAADGGVIIHFLSDQQWVVHWLLYVGPHGGEAVVATYLPYGFDFEPGETHPDYDISALTVFDPSPSDAQVCSESFSEFVYRFWIENEIWFRLKSGPLTDEQRHYLNHYRDRPTP